MTFRVYVWCSDCIIDDPMGCFDGGVERREEIFETREEAEAWAEDFTYGPPWSYEIEERP